MEKGELSNALVPVWIVTLDAVVGVEMPKKRRFESWEKVADRVPFSQVAVSMLWTASFKIAARWEMACFEFPDKFGKHFLTRLDEEMAHPVQHIHSYADRHHLASAIAFRPEVQYVVDHPDFALHYGTRGITLRGALGLG